MQSKFGSTTPLAANQEFYGPWIDMSGAGDIPQVFVSVLADQPGTLRIHESDNPTSPNNQTFVAGASVSANAQTTVTAQIKKRFYSVNYTNGATAQTSFSLQAVEYTPGVGLSQQRLLELILRELRIANLTLMQLREPYGSSVNIRPSLDQIES